MAKKNRKKAGVKKVQQQEKKASQNQIIEPEVVEDLEQLYVDQANAVPDVLAQFPVFKKCKRTQHDLDVSLTYFNSAKTMDKAMMNWIYELAKSNMEDVYNKTAGWSWKSKVKRRELNDSASRYIVLSHNNEKSNEQNIPVQNLCGFVHLRFEVEDDDPVLYVYEIQLDESVQRKGLGKFVMSVLELIAWKNEMDKVMLTVQKENAKAVNFYHKLGYFLDETDLSVCEPDEPPVGYEIRSKVRPAKTKQTPKTATKADTKEEYDEDDDYEDGDEEAGEGGIGDLIRNMLEQDGPVVSLLILEPDGRVEEKVVDMTPKNNSATELLGGIGTFLGQWEEEEQEDEDGVVVDKPEVDTNEKKEKKEDEDDEEEEEDDDDEGDDDEGDEDWEEISMPDGKGSVVIAMVKRDETDKLKPSKHTLPPPLQDVEAKGRILLIRMDENATPQNLTLKDWNELRERQERKPVDITG